ncbi:MAG: helix-turn-helix domain-containing protein [Pseudolabrys sp.]|jgi:dCTP deaminase
MAAGSRGKTDPDKTSVHTAPGAHLRAELRRLGLDQVAVSKATGVSRQSVNNIINGRQAISRAMAGKLGRLTGHSSDYWLSEGFGETGGPAHAAMTGLLVDHQIARAVRDGVIVIRPMIMEHLRPASLDLTLGRHVLVGSEAIDLMRKKPVALKPGCALFASTAEEVELPLDYLGRLGGVARLVAHGLILSSPLQVEPGFRGPLQFAMFNAGAAPFALRHGDAVVTLEILRLAARVDADRRP